ncbi:MAG: hypothetical protein ACTHOL_17105 [Luteibacter jiangsuensis]
MKTPDEFAEAMKGRVSARKSKPANVWWPDVGNLDQASSASDMGFAAASLVAGVNAIAATLSLVLHTAVIGVDASAYVDATLFALAGWGIRRRSRVAALAGLLLFLFEKVYQLITQPKSIMGLALALVLLMGFVNAVRGNFAYHRFVPEGFVPEEKPIMVLGVNLRRPFAIWITALLCLAVLYKVVMGWVGANLYFFAFRAAALILVAMTFHAIFQRPAWGRALTAVFSLLVAAFLVFVAATSHPPTMAAELLVWAMLVGPAALYAYAMCLGRPIRKYFDQNSIASAA